MTNREIDALVAEKVIGLKLSERVPNSYEVRTIFNLGYLPIPAYTTDIAADYEVLCKVRETWDEDMCFKFIFAFWEVLCSPGHEWSEQLRISSRPFHHMFYQPGDYSRAALKALQEQQP